MKLLIVVSKLLTGFDAPSCTYIYLDNELRDHNLFQAICRTNRLDGDDKDYGHIVDFKELFGDVQEAIAVYSSDELDTDEGSGDGRDTPLWPAFFGGTGDRPPTCFGLVNLAGDGALVAARDRRVVLGEKGRRIDTDEAGEGTHVTACVEVAAAPGVVVALDPPDDRFPDPGPLTDLGNGETGLLTKPDSTALADAAIGLLLDAERRTRMAARARAVAEREFDVRLQIDRTLAVYEAAAQRVRAARF